jgi:superfamily II DNA/RNA helicase
MLSKQALANREQVEQLQQLISPYMLRRVKEDVAKDIPAKEETVIDVELTSVQKQYYRAIFEHNHAFLNIGSGRNTAPKLMNIQMELRKVCNHPFLLAGIEHREMDRLYNDFSARGAFKGKSAEEQQHMLNEQGYILSSGKMVLLDKLLPKLRQEGHKILIFSQMVKMLDLISEYCEFRDYRFERLDGRVRGTERQKAIDRFEREEDSFLFLLSTRAGGVGINLTAADVCIIFDSDWNPQNDIQAQARCHRIGQTKDVRIYRLVTSRSFEQEMFDRASKKLGLEQAILGTFEKGLEDDKPTQQEMEQLLKRGAYALLEDDNDEITREFCADDIESILAKRTRTRVVEGTKTASWLNKNGMVVSKSKFSAEGGESLDMDDPLFWQKVMPDFVTPSIMLRKLNDLQDDIEGTVRGPGRGRGRKKNLQTGKDADTVDDKAESIVQADEEEAETLLADATLDEMQDDVEDTARGPVLGREKRLKAGKDAATVDDKTEEAEALLADETLDEMSDDQSENDKGKKGKVELSRSYARKVQKFMTELKGMMENIFEEEDEEGDGLSSDEKGFCQKLLLTISVKEKFFTEEQRRIAKMFLKRLEGDRRRRCRTSERFIPGAQEDEAGNIIPEQLMILGKKRKKRVNKRVVLDDVDETPKGKRRTSDNAGGYVGDDGYLHHSDSEDDWSDVGEDIYGVAAATKKDRISSKEARRRRQWAADDDDATAAGRAWPVFPRHAVKKILSTVLEEMMKHDERIGGVFSEPVSREDFPEYYDQIKKPMDYSAMKVKLENGEYRSAQAMQKDFILILQNCRQFNALTSDIVKEARAQHLLRPKLLKEAAIKHGLFLAEDGSALEIFDEEKASGPKKKTSTGETDNGADDRSSKVRIMVDTSGFYFRSSC